MEQKERTDQASTAMTEMSFSVSDVADNASQAAVATQSADDAATKGRTLVQQAVDSIEGGSPRLSMSFR
mgnify:CR=1 FL=1